MPGDARAPAWSGRARAATNAMKISRFVAAPKSFTTTTSPDHVTSALRSALSKALRTGAIASRSSRRGHGVAVNQLTLSHLRRELRSVLTHSSRRAMSLRWQWRSRILRRILRRWRLVRGRRATLELRDRRSALAVIRRIDGSGLGLLLRADRRGVGLDLVVGDAGLPVADRGPRAYLRRGRRRRAARHSDR